MRVLVVEDDNRLAQLLTRQVAQLGLACDRAGSLAEADEFLFLHDYDLVILDRRLPDGDGLSLCADLRQREARTAILVLTVLDSTEDTVLGLAQGADDYLTKPFDLKVLEARIKALLRRRQLALVQVLTFGDLRLDLWKREAYCGANRLPLTAKELAILEALMQAQGGLVTRSQLLEYAWGEEQEPMSNTIEVLVSRLRRRLAQAGSSVQIRGVRGSGYKLE
ncbi:MAG: response regulator transcription factor [Acidobacteriota bacterium]